MAPVDLTENKKSLLESLEMKVCAMIGNRRSEQKNIYKFRKRIGKFYF